jgi:hypothetical protein
LRKYEINMGGTIQPRMHKSEVPRWLNFVQCSLIFSDTLSYTKKKNAYKFTCTKQKAPDNSDVHRSLQNFGSTVCNLFISPPTI